MSEFVEIDAMIAKVRALGAMPELVAVEAAPLVEKAAKVSASAGIDADTGAAWAPRKADGGRALAGASKAVTAKAVGSVVQIRLDGVEVYHQFSKGHPRHVIPSRGAAVPPAILEACLEGATRVFRRLTGAT